MLKLYEERGSGVEPEEEGDDGCGIDILPLSDGRASDGELGFVVALAFQAT